MARIIGVTARRSRLGAVRAMALAHRGAARLSCALGERWPLSDGKSMGDGPRSARWSSMVTCDRDCRRQAGGVTRRQFARGLRGRRCAGAMSKGSQGDLWRRCLGECGWSRLRRIGMVRPFSFTLSLLALSRQAGRGAELRSFSQLLGRYA